MGPVRVSQKQLVGILAFMIAIPCLSPVLAKEKERDLIPIPKVAAGSIAIGGEYRALIIGIDHYEKVEKLETAVKDATALRDVLIGRYGFPPANITLLLNEQATRRGIETALYRVRKQSGKDDSVLIYYAGHGQLDKEDEIGYWVPVDGEAQDPSTFISNAVIRDGIAAMKARHVYLVADSCFSGSLFAKSRALPPLNDKFFARLYENKSRWGLTSGQNEPVADRGKDGHSMFAYFFLKLLKENDDPYLVPSRIYDQLAPLVSRNATQQPRSQPLQGAGDEGGQFVFRLASASSGRVSPPVSSNGGSSDEMARMKAKLDALEAQLNKPADPPKPIQMAKAPAYDAPQQTGRERTGQDEAAMVLVPGGQFWMGSSKNDVGRDIEDCKMQYNLNEQTCKNWIAAQQPRHQVTLDAFYLDTYEVTNRLFDKFVKATGYQTTAEKKGTASVWIDGKGLQDTSGASWRQPEGGAVVFASDRAHHPVVSVSWHDAEAYCRWAGQRLPTEAEFEYATRAGTQTKYWWGNGLPGTRKVANVADESGRNTFSAIMTGYDDGYVKTAPVGSFEANPFGLFDMTGNVDEWTADWYGDDYYATSPEHNPTGPSSGEHRVLRGGAWSYASVAVRSATRMILVPSTTHASIGFRCAQDGPIDKAPAYDVPQQVGREITGKDGAPMMLVPAGEFFYGDNKQRLSLPAFYLDKYELSTRLYAQFLQATGRPQPDGWSQQVALVGNGDRPVVDVNWYDADAYCRHYGKRLPTEQEWEKAARGTDGRTYPWGNEEPTSRHTLFGNEFGTLAVAGSHEAGASPYGIHDLAGNVWEWTSTDYDGSGNYRVRRGGSVENSPVRIRSAYRGRVFPRDRGFDFGFRCAQDVPR